MEKHDTVKTPDMAQRLHLLNEKVHTHYESLGHSPRHPYVYVVYDPDDERFFPEVILQYLHEDESLAFATIDLLPLTIESLEDDEAGHLQVLHDPMLAAQGRHEIVQLWSDVLCERIVAAVAQLPVGKRPVAILYGVAALHPLGTPTDLMKLVAQIEPRDARTGRPVPIVVFVPGYSPKYVSSRFYHFLDEESPRLQFYREGESM